MFRVALCQFSDHDKNEIRNYFSLLEFYSVYSFNTKYFSSGDDLLEYYNASTSPPFDIILLEIKNENKDGIETAKLIRSIPDFDVQIVFISDTLNYMHECFNNLAIQYLLKPITYNQFGKYIKDVCYYIMSNRNHFFPLKVDRDFIILRNRDIIAISKLKEDISRRRIEVMTTELLYEGTGVLSDLVNRLDSRFLQIYRSVIINMQHISRFTSKTIIMTNESEFPVSRLQINNIKITYNKFLSSL